MRAGACTIQQTLTAEAASVLKHSLNLARRRGHAQATPLHVAATLLSSRTSMLRRACLKSHPHSFSHPLQCRALELCFNVALNRLPTTPGPLFHGQPSLSNALIAAVKRAQAHQRRGCIEQQQQQQPLLAIKVELEQLVISILDDPSVSRVMREAGFSSTCVKNNLEDSSSSSSILQCYSSNGLIGSLHFSTESRMEVSNHGGFRPTHFVNPSSEQNSVLFPSQKKNFVSILEDSNSENEDFRLVLDVLMKNKNTVIVGDCSSDTEGLVLEFMRKTEKGEVPEELRGVKFVKFIVSLVTLKLMKRGDVEKNITNLRKQVNSLALTGGAVIYVGDLKWTVEEAVAEKNEALVTENISDYSSVSHMIQEISKILSDFSSFTSKVWLMATANYQTFMKCQMRQPPLETQWAFQAVQVPSGGLALSLQYSSDIGPRVGILQDTSEIKPNEEQDKLMCCSECTSNFEKEAGVSISTSFPSWSHYNTSENKQKDFLLELKRKWNRFCHVLHRPRGSNIPYKSSLLNHTLRSSTHSFFSASLQYNHNNTFPINKSIAFSDTSLNPKSNFDFVSSFRNYDSTNDFTISSGNFHYSDNQKYQSTELSLSPLKKSENKEDKVFLALGNSLFSESPTSIKQNWRESKDLCQELQENIPWQAETIRIITQVLPNFNKSSKGGTWLLLQGNDWIGKRRLARAMAELYCGSCSQFLRITAEMINENENSCIDSIFEILKGGKMCVILIENVDYMDTHLLTLLEHGFKTGDIEDPHGKSTDLCQAIFILSTGIFEDSKKDSVIQMKLYVDDQTKQISDSKDRKRAAESDLSNGQKFLKTDEKEWSKDDLENTEKKLLRLSSLNDLDLNIQVEEEDHNLDESKAVSSDLTHESSIDFHCNKRFIDMIKNKFVFEQNPYQIDHMEENFLSKIRSSLYDLGEIETEDYFVVDQSLLKELVYSSPCFLIHLFEKWLQDVLQTSFKTVKTGGKHSTLRLSLDLQLQGGKEEKLSEFGFEGSCLPKRIQIRYKD